MSELEKTELEKTDSEKSELEKFKERHSLEKLDGVITVNKNEATITTQPKSEQIPKEKITAILGNLSRSQKATQY